MNEMKTNRRRFLQHAGSAAASALILGETRLLANIPLRPAVPITTVIAVVQAGISVAEFFKGASPSAMSDLQLKLLQNIVARLQLVQDSLNVILGDLSEIKRLLGELPEVTGRHINEMNVRGSLNSYAQHMDTFRRYNMDRNRFMRASGGEVQQLYDNIDRARNILITYDHPLHASLVGAAAYVQFNCMWFLNKEDNVIRSAMGSYGTYLRRMLYENHNSLEKQIKEARELRTKLVSDSSKAIGFAARIDSNFGGGWHFLVIGHTENSVALDRDINSAEVSELVKRGLIEDEEREIKLTLNKFVKGNQRTNHNVGDVVGTSGSFATNIVDISTLPSYGGYLASIEKQSKDLETEINLTTRRLYALVSCFYAANRALNFCQQFNA